MKKIKTKENYNISDFTRETVNVSKKINSVFIKTKSQADKVTESDQTGAYEYTDESYKNMIEDHKKNGTSYKDIQTFNLDEYFGLDQSHPQSYPSIPPSGNE